MAELRDIHIWSPLEDGTWKVDQRTLVGDTASVEDLQWRPNEGRVLASCSIDKSIRIWDVRAPPQKSCMLTCFSSTKAKKKLKNCTGTHSSRAYLEGWRQVITFDQLGLKSPTGNNCLLLQSSRADRTACKAPGVSHSHTRPYVRSKGRKLQRARGRRSSCGYKK